MGAQRRLAAGSVRNPQLLILPRYVKSPANMGYPACTDRQQAKGSAWAGRVFTGWA
jgi:hypothetical protein